MERVGMAIIVIVAMAFAGAAALCVVDAIGGKPAVVLALIAYCAFAIGASSKKGN